MAGRNSVTSRSGRIAEHGKTITRRAAKRAGRLGWLRWTALALAGVALILGATLAVRIAMLPDLETLEARVEDRLTFTDAGGEPLMFDGAKPSDYATIDRIPKQLQQAVVAVEDARFYEHGGLDYRAIGRAFVANAQAGGIVQGGSTITQQLVKVRYLDREKTYGRKLHEALLARELEAAWGKEKILERYLNTIYFGEGAYGVVAAARLHFDRPLEELTLAESAALAAMIQAPSAVNPTANPDALRARAALVLSRMEAEGMIDSGAANAARVALTTLEPRHAEPAYGGWFADWVASRAAGVSDQFEGNSTIRTTLDPELQMRAERAVNEVLGEMSAEAAVVVLRSDGTVAAMVGGRDYRASQYNRAVQAVRQPGSTFKTFTYLAALEAGFSPDDVISDAEIEIDGYSPANFDDRFHGEVTLREAFARSYNAAAVRLAQQVGIDRVAKAARALGIEAELSETPSLALGASGVTLMDLTEAYAALATGRPGLKARGLSGITTGEEGTFYPFEWADPAADAYAQSLMAQRGPMVELLRAVVTDGTGEAVAQVPGAVGKTGTSQNFRDALFVGWAGDMIAGVWVGNDDNAPMDKVTGGGAPAQIWAAVMSGAVGAPADAVPSVAPSDGQNMALAPAGETSDVAPAEAPASEASATAGTRTLISAPARNRATTAPQPDAERPAALASAEGSDSPPAAPRADTLPQIGDEEPAEPGPKIVSAPEPSPAVDADRMRVLLEAAQDGEVQQVVDALRSEIAQDQPQCNVSKCEAFYRSFRASDCTFQPYGGGPRELCTR